MTKIKTNDEWLTHLNQGRSKRLSTPMASITNSLLNGQINKEAAVIVVKSGDRVLFQQRRDTLLWCLPGGGCENGESAFQTAVRELKEETNIDADDLDYIGNGMSVDGTLVHCFMLDFRESRTDYSEVTFRNDPDLEACSFVWARPGTDIWKHVIAKAQYPNNIALKLMRLQ